MMNTILLDRNKQINLLNLENEKLNNENKVLFDESQLLKTQNYKLEEKLKNLEYFTKDCLYCSAKGNKGSSNSRNQHSAYASLANEVINTAQNDILFNTVSSSNTNTTSMITIKKLNIKALNQINNLANDSKKQRKRGYYKNITKEEKSSTSSSVSRNESKNNSDISKSYIMNTQISNNTNNEKANPQSIHTASIKPQHVS